MTASDAMIGVEISPGVRELIREATACRLLSLAFERPRDGWAEETAALAAQLGDDPMIQLARLAAEQASESLYLDVLGPGGAVSPREVAYSGWENPGDLLASLSAMYEAFAYLPTTEDCADHVAVELGFLGYLRMKEGYARAAGDGDDAEIAAEAARMFIAHHLGRLANGVHSRFAADGDFYLRLAATLAIGIVGDMPIASGPPEPALDDEILCGGC